MSNLASPTIAQTQPLASYLAHRPEIDAAIERVLLRGQYVLGEEVATLETELPARLGVAHGVGVASGTDALALALRACGVGSGDAVITVSHTAVATVAAIELVGAIAVAVDIDPATFTLDPNRLDDLMAAADRGGCALPGRAAAIIAVHLYGHPADMPAIVAIGERHGVPVIEDCAQSLGAAIDGRPTGTWGELAALSFYPTKNLGALGDGGMVVTQRSELAERIRRLRQYGWDRRRISETVGFNSRLDEIQAAVLRAKLGYLDADNQCRRLIANAYRRGLRTGALSLPSSGNGITHAWHQFVVRTPKRDALKDHLARAGIDTTIHYPRCVHNQPAYAHRLFIHDSLSNSEKAAAEVLSLPLYPELSGRQVAAVVDTIRAWECPQC